MKDLLEQSVELLLRPTKEAKRKLPILLNVLSFEQHETSKINEFRKFKLDQIQKEGENVNMRGSDSDFDLTDDYLIGDP